MSVPNGFDLFKYGGLPIIPIDMETHPIHAEFLKSAIRLGFDVLSDGFKESADAYFNFFLAGAELK